MTELERELLSYLERLSEQHEALAARVAEHSDFIEKCGKLLLKQADYLNDLKATTNNHDSDLSALTNSVEQLTSLLSKAIR